MSDQGEHDPWADGEDLPAADPWADDEPAEDPWGDDDPWAEEPELLADDPAAWAAALQTYHDEVAAAPKGVNLWREEQVAKARAADKLRAFARRYGLLGVIGGVYGVHLARPTKRLGSTHDPAGEHCWLEPVTGDGVGHAYRRLIAGGKEWHRPLDAEDLEIARRAPHIKSTLGIS